MPKFSSSLAPLARILHSHVSKCHALTPMICKSMKLPLYLRLLSGGMKVNPPPPKKNHLGQLKLPKFSSSLAPLARVLQQHAYQKPYYSLFHDYKTLKKALFFISKFQALSHMLCKSMKLPLYLSLLSGGMKFNKKNHL